MSKLNVHFEQVVFFLFFSLQKSEYLPVLSVSLSFCITLHFAKAVAVTKHCHILSVFCGTLTRKLPLIGALSQTASSFDNMAKDLNAVAFLPFQQVSLFFH